MDKYTQAAIIGYWRCGAETSEIEAITGVRYFLIKELIKDYQYILKLNIKDFLELNIKKCDTLLP